MARYLGLAVMFVFLLTSAAFCAGVSDIPRISPEQLNELIARGERIVVVDVRSPGSYERSVVKIRGAVRVAPSDLDKSAAVFVPGNSYVFYCT